MNYPFLCAFLFLCIPIIGMDLDTEFNQEDIQQEVQQLDALWQRVKVSLHKAVQTKNLNQIVCIFDACFKCKSDFLKYKKDACNIVLPFVREALEEEVIVGLSNGMEALKIADLFGLWSNKEFMTNLESISAGVYWLRTGVVTKKLDIEQILNDWYRIVRSYVVHACKQNNTHVIEKFLRVYGTSSNRMLQPYLLEMNTFISSQMPDKQMSAIEPLYCNTPLVNTPESVQQELDLIEQEVVEQHPEDIQSEEEHETVSSAEEEITQQPNTAPTRVIKKPQAGIMHWIQQQPLLSVIGVVAVCGGVYKYLKKEKKEEKKVS